jgi:hypothetical protein
MNIIEIIQKTVVPSEGINDTRPSDFAFVVLICAVGAFLRFWGLGNVGLHGDEETMALPAIAVLEQGGPYLPSGMFYPRALVQIYLMAGSVWMFGESEWAFRLPSAVIGSLMPLLAFFLGRRFLSSPFNLLFVSAIAFLPALIEYSQTARMYIFWLAALIVFGTSIFRWERLDSRGSLIAAFVAWLVALHFHALSLLAAPLFLFPGLNRRSWRQLVQGVAVSAACFVAYKVNGNWIGAQYPDSSERPARDFVETVSEATLQLPSVPAEYPWLVLVGLAISLAGVAWCGFRVNQNRRFITVVALLLFLGGYTACLGLYYHAGILAIVIGSVIWVRNSLGQLKWLYISWAVVGSTAAFQALSMYRTGEFPGRKLIGAMVGDPSVWPMLRFAEYSPAAAGLYCVLLAYGIYRLASRERVPDHMLFFAMAVWAPLIVIGFATWYLPPRYTVGVLPYFLLCCLAGVEYLVSNWTSFSSYLNNRKVIGVAVSVLLVILIVNPLELRKVVNTSYDLHPDHKGAAVYLKDLPISDDDLVIAEDILQQTYYLGSVDYWLRNYENARKYAVVKNGIVLDQYTSTPIIGSGPELLQILEENASRRVFIIGSGEIYPGNDEWARGRGIREVLELKRFDVVYKGRDGLTKVWRDGA